MLAVSLSEERTAYRDSGFYSDKRKTPNGWMMKSWPLHYAADGHINDPNWEEERQVRTIGVLLAAGADINAQDANSATPLHRAVRTRCAAAVQCLLTSGCDAALKNKSGSTPFDLAVHNPGRGGTGTTKAKAAHRRILESLTSHGMRGE